MTWIVGAASAFGSAILVSDIQVTFRQTGGSAYDRDCLQKIYPVGRFVLGGFAGSVRIGFAMLEALRRESAKMSDDQAWQIDVISNTWWPRVARRIFAMSDESERVLGSSIILASAHPTRNRGEAPWAWTDIHTYSSPDFAPTKADYKQPLSIGGGASVAAYMDTIREVCEDDFQEAIKLGPMGQASFLASSVESRVREMPTPGISSLFQVGIITRGPYQILDHEYDVFNADGTTTNIRFPNIARNYQEFRDQCAQTSCVPGGASCPV